MANSPHYGDPSCDSSLLRFFDFDAFYDKSALALSSNQGGLEQDASLGEKVLEHTTIDERRHYCERAAITLPSDSISSQRAESLRDYQFVDFQGLGNPSEHSVILDDKTQAVVLTTPTIPGFGENEHLPHVHQHNFAYLELDQVAKASLIAFTQPVRHIARSPEKEYPSSLDIPITGSPSSRAISRVTNASLQAVSGVALPLVQPSLVYVADPDSRTGKVARKQLCSPTLTNEANLAVVQQPSATRQLARQSGVPEGSVEVFSFGPIEKYKRRRTNDQQQNRKDVKRLGGSCFYCLLKKKKCSGQRPCRQCRLQWEKHVNKSTCFRWTCDVRSRLVDNMVFKQPTGTYPESGYSLSQIRENIGLVDAVFIEFLPQIMRFEVNLGTLDRPCLEFNSQWFFPIDVKFQGLRRHLELFYYKVKPWIPNLGHSIRAIGRMHRDFLHYMFDWCETIHLRDSNESICVGMMTLTHIQILKENSIVESAAADHFELALRNRLEVLAATLHLARLRNLDKHVASSWKFEIKFSSIADGLLNGTSLPNPATSDDHIRDLERNDAHIFWKLHCLSWFELLSVVSLDDCSSEKPLHG